MKNTLLSIMLTFTAGYSFGQFQWCADFDSPWCLNRTFVDTISNPNCIWQIGQPRKTVFISAHSALNAIVTDTLNPVPANDTSIFYLKHVRSYGPFHLFYLAFWHQMNGDSTDYGTIEISPDNGLNWINMLTQDTAYQLYWLPFKPSLSGSTSGWQRLGVDMSEWASGWGNFPIAMTADTIQFRFTYITGSSLAERDGWIIDDFNIGDDWSGIEEIQNDDLILIYPNPVKDKLFIKTKNINNLQSVQIINSQGRIFYENKYFNENFIDIQHLNNGVYFLRYSNANVFSIKKFIVNH